MRPTRGIHAPLAVTALLVAMLALFTCTGPAASLLNLPFFGKPEQPSVIDAQFLPQPQDRASSYVPSALSWPDLVEYDGQHTWILLDDGEPQFAPDELTTKAYERYSPLDDRGRAGVAMACLGPETLPTEQRGDISEIHPSGWRNDEYSFIEGHLLFNRAHLIAFSLAAENANAWNFVTGTRYLNAELMLPYEQETLYYIRSTGNHVLYRVSPIFNGDEVLCRGVHMEGYSVEDNGDGICFNVFLYNVQPGVAIDYATGENHAEGAIARPGEEPHEFVLNVKSRKIHLPSCPAVKDISPANRQDVYELYSQLELEGYKPCEYCKPYTLQD